jgi:hypothetical protein
MKKILAVIMVMFFCFAGCVAAGPRPPIELPFAVHQAGAMVSTELWIVENGPYKYPFDLKFIFNEKDKKDRERVLKLVGRYERDARGKLRQPGITIPLKLTITIIDSSGERLLLQKEVSVGPCYAYGHNDFLRRIDEDQIKMPPGLYRVTVQNLKDIPELADTKVFFTIYNPRK